MDTKAQPLTLDQVPRGHWVVLTSDHARVVSHDADLKRALAAAEKSGERDLVFMKAESVGEFLIVAIR